MNKDWDRVKATLWDAEAPDATRGAIVILYLHAVLELIVGNLSFIFYARAGLIAGGLIAAVGIVAHKRWAYSLGIGVSVAHIALFAALWIAAGAIGDGVIDLFFAGIQLALLVHRETREHQRLSFT